MWKARPQPPARRQPKSRPGSSFEGQSMGRKLEKSMTRRKKVRAAGCRMLRFSGCGFCIYESANPHPFNNFQVHSNYTLNKH